MRPDPRPRRDGTCAVCRRKRKPPATNYGLADWLLDPFCSTTCCRAFHNTAVKPGWPKTENVS